MVATRVAIVKSLYSIFTLKAELRGRKERPVSGTYTVYKCKRVMWWSGQLTDIYLFIGRKWRLFHFKIESSTGALLPACMTASFDDNYLSIVEFETNKADTRRYTRLPQQYIVRLPGSNRWLLLCSLIVSVALQSCNKHNYAYTPHVNKHAHVRYTGFIPLYASELVIVDHTYWHH